MTTGARVPKILGSDVELGNFIDGLASSTGTGAAASRLLLQEIHGIPAGRTGGAAEDWGRRFLPGNGGCAYIDSDHLELATPETLSAFDYVAWTQAMLRLARAAVDRANARMPAGCRVRALANCSDGHGHSYGAHLSVLLTRAAWDAVIRRKPHYLACLAAFQASSIVFTGAGKVGSENGRPWAGFQLSQRADFLESFLGEQTTHNRPLVNARDESLCGPGRQAGGPGTDAPDLARLHVIFFDATRCQVATLLRAGTMQLMTAMLEADDIPTHLALDDPLDAVQAWSRDPSLGARARLVSGEAVTAVELQQRFVEHAGGHRAKRGFDAVVPRAGDILALWADTLDKLRAGDVESLAGRLDWVLKRQILLRTMASRPSLSWASCELQYLDQLYASIDEPEGLFLACEASGQIDAVVREADIVRAMQEPPDDTRAWTRAALLRRAGAARVEHVDWDGLGIRLDLRRHGYTWSTRATVPLPCPYTGTRRDNEAACAPDQTLEDIVAALEARRSGAIDLPARYSVN